MLGHIIFSLLISVIIYAYIDHNGHFTATTTAIQQIWSGNCRQSCLNKKPVQFGSLVQSDEGATSSQVGTGYQDDCICASCPCQLVENVLQTCSPITQLYYTIVEGIFLAFYDLIKACTELYERTNSRLQNNKQRTESLRVSQIGIPQVTNFMFSETAKMVIMRPEDRDPASEPGTSNVQKRVEAKTSTELSEDTDGISCPSCVEKGVTCIEPYNILAFKLLLYSLLLTLLLHCPLGDTQGPGCYCARWSQEKKIVIDYLCDVYRSSKNVANDTLKALYALSNVISDHVHRTKILIYKALGQVDSDMCLCACSDSRCRISQKKAESVKLSKTETNF